MEISNMIHCRNIWFLCLFVMAEVSALEHHPGLELTESTRADSAAVHRLITARVKRKAGDVEPEAAEFVRGVKTTETYSVPASQSTASLVAFYRNQLSLEGQLLFECEGRGCGPSNYWSNQVFERPRLYGPLEYQHYILAKLDDEAVDYVTLYFSQRGTGSRYLHAESISAVNEAFDANPQLVSSMLRLQRRFVFEPDAKTLTALRDVINANPEFSLAIVAHSAPLADESFDESIAKTTERAEQIKSRLSDMGADTRSLQALGLGPASPVAKSDVGRLELVRLN